MTNFTSKCWTTRSSSPCRHELRGDVLQGYSFPSAASHQVPLGRRGSRCPNDASRVSRSRLEACQPKGARARLDWVTQIRGSPGGRLSTLSQETRPRWQQKASRRMWLSWTFSRQDRNLRAGRLDINRHNGPDYRAAQDEILYPGGSAGGSPEHE